MQVKKGQLEPDLGKWTGSKLGKEYIKAVYCHPAYLTYIQSTSCEMPHWMKHTVKAFSVVNAAEVDVFLEFSCFFDESTYVGDLISGSSALSKSSLGICKFLVHVLLRPGLENFEHYFTSR